MIDYLTNLRLQVYSRRQVNQVDLGDYTPLSETEDLRGLVGMLMRRVEALEWEREEERERKGQRGMCFPWSLGLADCQSRSCM
jgi:hypothetical protein